MLNEKTCPYCGGSDLLEAEQTTDYSNVRPRGAVFSSDQKLFMDVCASCGTVVRSYVEKPEKLRR